MVLVLSIRMSLLRFGSKGVLPIHNVDVRVYAYEYGYALEKVFPSFFVLIYYNVTIDKTINSGVGFV